MLNTNLNDRAIGIIYSKETDSILLMWRFKKDREYYVFPGGTLEDGEEPETTLVREMFEELNLTVKVGPLMYEYFNNYIHPRNEYYYLITEYTGEIKLGFPELGHQHQQNIYRPEWVKISELKTKGIYPVEVLDIIIEQVSNFR